MLEVAALHWPLRRRWEIGCSYLKWKVRWTQGSGGPGGSEGCRAQHGALDNQVWVYSLPECLRTGLFTGASPVRCSSHICSLESLSASGGPLASVCIRNLSAERNGFTYTQSDSSLWECLWMCRPPLLPGVIRDWKNQFTDAQTKKFNEDYEKHMADTSLSFHMHCKRQPTWSRRESDSKTTTGSYDPTRGSLNDDLGVLQPWIPDPSFGWTQCDVSYPASICIISFSLCRVQSLGGCQDTNM